MLIWLKNQSGSISKLSTKTRTVWRRQSNSTTGPSATQRSSLPPSSFDTKSLRQCSVCVETIRDHSSVANSEDRVTTLCSSSSYFRCRTTDTRGPWREQREGCREADASSCHRMNSSHLSREISYSKSICRSLQPEKAEGLLYRGETVGDTEENLEQEVRENNVHPFQNVRKILK